MTVNPVDMQVVVPRVGEVERVNRTVQGQQQTDQQILNQVVQDSLQHEQQKVQELKSIEQRKVETEERKKQREQQQQEKERKKQEQEGAADSIAVSMDAGQSKAEDKEKAIGGPKKKGLHIDIRI
ncbi:MAG: hypothetical protein ACOX23_01395 [Peptococcia bacterium]|jgi:ATPase subunit of ABC transporter with duplicated ATPase domains